MDGNKHWRSLPARKVHGRLWLRWDSTAVPDVRLAFLCGRGKVLLEYLRGGVMEAAACGSLPADSAPADALSWGSRKLRDDGAL